VPRIHAPGPGDRKESDRGRGETAPAADQDGAIDQIMAAGTSMTVGARRVLIASADAAFAAAASKLMGAHGHVVAATDDATNLMASLAELDPLVVVIDAGMGPGSDGDLFRRVALARPATIAIAAVDAGRTDAGVAALEDGAYDFIDKGWLAPPAVEEPWAASRLCAIVDRAIAKADDMTERRRIEGRMTHMAHHDALTGLPHRAVFAEHLAAEIAQASAAGTSFALMCLDLDRFKGVNDVFGHAIGDGLLCEVARRLQQAADGGFLARMGGDEFTLIVDGGPQPARAEAVAARLMASLDSALALAGHELRIGLSIGVAVFPDDGDDVAALIRNADAALDRAKAAGRGSIRFFETAMESELRERRSLQLDLQSARARGELSLHYQPQALATGEIIGFEALVRWTHPSRGAVPPAVFIPLSEESGLIMAIGEWVLREACREAATWSKPLSVAVNLSPAQFRHGDLAGLVHGILLETGLAPSRLELEITEGVLFGDFPRALSILRRLKALGARIAVDDFGTGHSSLANLQAFPFDKIKIDRSFIASMSRAPQSQAIVRAVIGLARGLNLPVVAEGVETSEQLAFLCRESCDEVQGYFVGRPSPIQTYAALVGRHDMDRRLRERDAAERGHALLDGQAV
jgi:diguanylate cyclase (GGDEF)-like protein